jgi:hypothetical protein
MELLERAFLLMQEYQNPTSWMQPADLVILVLILVGSVYYASKKGNLGGGAATTVAKSLKIPVVVGDETTDYHSLIRDQYVKVSSS